MQVGLTEAAKMTGKDPSTITRAVNNGKLSASQDAMGSRVFDIAELQRVYGPLQLGDEKPGQRDANDINVVSISQTIERLEETHAREVSLLREQIRLLERQLEDLRADRDKWQGQAGQITRMLADESGKADRGRDQLIEAKEEAAAARTLAELEAATHQRLKEQLAKAAESAAMASGQRANGKLRAYDLWSFLRR